MKLWKKIAVISCAVVVLLFTGSFLTVTQQVKNNALTHTRQEVREDHGNLVFSFLRQMQKEQVDPDGGLAALSQTRYIFEQLGDDSSILVKEGQILSSHLELDPRSYLTGDPDGHTAVLETEVAGVPYLMLASWIAPSGPEDPGYTVYTVLDLTPIYGEIRHMALTTAGITGTGLILGLILIVALAAWTMKPLEALTRTASHMAQGNYRERTGLIRRDEIGELSRSFDRMADSVEQTVEALQEQNRRQKLFIGAVSHEFKTPLTSLLLNADSLQNTLMTEEEQLDTAANMEKQCRRLEKLTGSLLKLLTAEQELTLENVKLPELLEDLRDSCREILEPCGVTLEIACDDTTILLDRTLMLSALLNLVHNAARASKPGQAVEVYVHGSTFEVTDHGRGIPREVLPRITEPFYMVDKSRSKKQGGTGLGLALVKEIVEAHGAALEIQSTVNAGTTVSFTLPKNAEEMRK